MSDYKLGKKIVPEPIDIEIEDEYEAVNTSGTILRNKRTGKLETSITPKGPQYPDPYQHMLDILKKQEEDGFPVFEFGVM